jgi:hypothetical protein
VTDGAAASETISDPAEDRASQRPSHQKGGLDIGAFQVDIVQVRLRLEIDDAQELSHEGGGHENIEIAVQAVEEPAEPGRQAGLPLHRSQFAQRSGFTRLVHAGSGRER